MFKKGQDVQIIGYFRIPVDAVILENQKQFDVTLRILTQEGYDLYIPLHFVHPVLEKDDV